MGRLADREIRHTHLGELRDDELSVIVVQEVPCEDSVLRFRTPVEFHPYYDEDIGLLCAENSELTVVAGGRTRWELLADIYDEIAIVWNGIALEEDGILSPGALELKRKLRQRVEETPRAAV